MFEDEVLCTPNGLWLVGEFAVPFEVWDIVLSASWGSVFSAEDEIDSLAGDGLTGGCAWGRVASLAVFETSFSGIVSKPWLLWGPCSVGRGLRLI